MGQPAEVGQLGFIGELAFKYDVRISTSRNTLDDSASGGLANPGSYPVFTRRLRDFTCT